MGGARRRCDVARYTRLMSIRILVGGALERLREMPAESVHCVVTSPPYWGLRSYEKDPGMIGLEPTFDAHLERLVAVFREVRRVMRPDATLWLNYGDAYTSGNRATQMGNVGGKDHPIMSGMPRPRTPAGLKPKDLMMMPARVALALQADGWWLRSEVVWHKPNPMPESCTDRPTSSHEKLYLLSKRSTYFYDAEAVRTPAGWTRGSPHAKAVPDRGKTADRGIAYGPQDGTSANLRNVWSIPTESFSEAHFATFPQKLVEPCIRAGTSERGVCAQCGAPWVREVETTYTDGRAKGGFGTKTIDAEHHRWETMPPKTRHDTTTGWRPSCECAHDTVPAVVLDCFGGSGTVAVVAQELQRDAILIEISPTYAEMARERIERPHRPRMRPGPEKPLFAEMENA